MEENKYKVGDPVVCDGVFGRVSKVDGGIVYLTTPGESTLKAGCVWVRRALGEDLAALRVFEKREKDPYPRWPELREAMDEEHPAERLRKTLERSAAEIEELPPWVRKAIDGMGGWEATKGRDEGSAS